MEEKVFEILKNALEIDAVNSAISRSNCEQWDSLKTLNIVIDLESEFGVDFEPDEIERMDSASAILSLLSEKISD